MNNQLIKMLIALKNASLAKQKTVRVTNTPLTLSCLSVLYREGLILSYTNNNLDSKVLVKLRFFEGNCLTTNIRIISKVSHIKYLDSCEICRMNLGNYTGFFLTNKGIQTLEECKANKVGGVLAFYS